MDGFINVIRGWIDASVAMLGPNPYLQALVLFLASVVVAKLASVFLCRGIGRWAKRSKTNLDDQFIRLVDRPVFVTLVLIGLVLATLRLGLTDRTTQVTISSLKSIGVWVWMVFAMRFTKLLLTVLSTMRDRFAFIDARTRPLLQNIAVILIIVGGIYALMQAWNVDVTALLASAGIIGLALSFAARDSLANVFAGVSILADNPYKVGDFVVLDTGERGMVTHIGIRSSRILTRDDVEVTIPNSVMGNVKIVNESGGPHEKYRIRLKVSVAYGSDLERVCEILKEIATSQRGVCEHPVPRVRVREFGDHGVVIELLTWVDRPVERGRMSHRLHLSVYKRFQEEGIEIPYPQQDLYVRAMPADENSAASSEPASKSASAQ